MRPLWYITVAVGLGGVCYQATKNWQFSLTCASAEVLMDLDHVFDHFIWSKHPLSLRKFLSSCNTFTWPRIVLLFHSYELILLLGIISWYFNLFFGYAITLGAIVHIILDEFGNRHLKLPRKIVPAFYFISYRLKKGFV